MTSLGPCSHFSFLVFPTQLGDRERLLVLDRKWMTLALLLKTDPG